MANKEVEQFSIESIIFTFFFFSFLGWVCESIQESIIRQKLVSKGFFKGPIVPCQGIGGLCVYALSFSLKAYPVAVFFTGIVVCTAIEYITAVFLEKCFKVKCWDYSTYPHTKWCHYKGRIALTISLFFGIITLCVVYVLWDAAQGIIHFFGNYMWLLNGILIAIFLADVIYTCTKLLRYKKAGIKIKGWAVFSDAGE
ncbi:hypothetical protein FACS1894172_12140 [Spirochaetia bacterium]|nr:hypothetical protein FACS1894164_01910 [Spirochaetia bacterium]GHU33499.1 hypothetical protein FACS1894172_12140 [Spirochaetia bacterium]